MESDTIPTLSVVLTLVGGEEALQRCLHALEAQTHAGPMEVIIPCDDSIAGISGIERDFPFARVLRMGRVRTARPSSSFAGQHELYDLRRAAGLRAATGDFLAVIEDRSMPRADWAGNALDEHRAGWAAVGGAVENAVDRPLNWAVYLCDFDRYRLPASTTITTRLSDVNVVYARPALESVRASWEHRYHEPFVHDALRESGGELLFSDRVIVDHVRDDPELLPLLGERFHWGRLYAARRSERIGPLHRFVLAVASPALPALLLTRICVRQLRKRRNTKQVIAALPLLLPLLAAWSAGEFMGYLTRRP